MILENWVVSASKFKRAVLAVTDHLVTRVNLEPLEDHEGTVGVKAVWEGERGESTLNVNAPSLKGNIKTAGDKAPTVEYWQQGDKRGFALRNPRSISCEFDKETFKKIETGKAAGIAIAAGAAVGLVGWCALVLMGRATLVKQEAEPSPPRHLESNPARGNSHDG
jgi:hypothetical protein